MEAFAVTVLRMSPEQIEARRRRLEKVALDKLFGNGTPPMPLAPSAAFVEAFGQARAVVEQYMSGNRGARSFVLRLSVPQSVNMNTRPTLSGGRILTDEHKAFRAEVAMSVYHAKLPKLYGKLRIYIRLNAPRVDIDNVVKPILDALQRAGAIENDRHVDDLHVQRSGLLPEGKVDVEVAEL